MFHITFAQMDDLIGCRGSKKGQDIWIFFTEMFIE